MVRKISFAKLLTQSLQVVNGGVGKDNWITEGFLLITGLLHGGASAVGAKLGDTGRDWPNCLVWYQAGAKPLEPL